jgi:hypothetical protein
MIEAARTSETLVNFYQTTRRYNPEDSHLRNHRRENLKPYLAVSRSIFDPGTSQIRSTNANHRTATFDKDRKKGKQRKERKGMKTINDSSQ